MPGRSLGDIAAILGSLIEESPLALAATEGAAHLIRYANPAFCRFAGRPLDVLLDRALAEAVPKLQKQGAMALLDRVYETGTAAQAVDLGPARLGPVRTHATYTIWPILGDDNQSTGLLMNAIDTTNQVLALDRAADAATEIRDANKRLLVAGLDAQEQAETLAALNTALREASKALRESESHFHAIFDQAATGIAESDLAGQFVQVNERYSEIVGRPRGELPGLRMQDITHPEDMSRHLELYAQMLADGTDFTIEKRYVRPDGSPVWVRVDVSRVDDPDGSPRYVVDVVQDISAQKATEEALRESEQRYRSIFETEQAARAEAQEALRVRDEFLTIAAHELRTPVTSAKGNAQMALRALQRGALDEARSERHLRAIVEASDRLEALLTDLLDVSRMRREGLTIRPERMDLVVLVDAVARRYAEDASDGHHLVVEMPHRPVTVDTDAGRLEQVLDNMLSNAVKYSPGGGEIRVALREADGGVALTVQDAGIGLPPGQQERIFKPFGRATNAAKSGLPGMGLGLHISRQIVEAHGGRMWVESEGEGQGTVVHVWLPAGSPDVPARPAGG